MSDRLIHEYGNERFMLGLTEPGVDDAVCCANFESVIEPYDTATLKKIAQSGNADHRNVFTSVYVQNQKSHGSCNGFAGATALRKAIIRSGIECPALSGTYLYSKINGNQDNGSNLNAGMKAMLDGICLESTVGPDKIYRSQYNNQQADKEAALRKGFECYALTSMQAYWTALALNFDVIFAIQVGGNFNRLDARKCPGVANGRGNHAMSAFSLFMEGGELTSRGQNHWDKTWGDGGFCNIQRANIESTIGSHVWYSVRSAQSVDNVPKFK
jgi:hypothetical protein